MKKYNHFLEIGDRRISIYTPTYFIADIASNHDRDLGRAKNLIWLAKEAGADAAKFQHFKAEALVSSIGFGKISTKAEHQKAWGKSVYEIYKANEYNREWDLSLHSECQKAEIDFMTSPYDLDAIEAVAPLVSAYKIGSGDITAIEILEAISKKPHPIFLACGASSMVDVERAVSQILYNTSRLALMQCNTNYTGSDENFSHINLRVLDTFSTRWPGLVLGLSDHTPGHSTVLGAVTLGARCIEKHFTDDNSRVGPDHPFSMTPSTWLAMVKATREVEKSLGDGVKRVQDNEMETVVVQRRSLHLAREMKVGEVICEGDLVSLRPAPRDAFFPYEKPSLIGGTLLENKAEGDYLNRSDVEKKD